MAILSFPPPPSPPAQSTSTSHARSPLSPSIPLRNGVAPNSVLKKSTSLFGHSSSRRNSEEASEKLEESVSGLDNSWGAGMTGGRTEGERVQEFDQLDVEQLREGEDESDMIVVSEDDTRGNISLDTLPTLHIEVRLLPNSTLRYDILRSMISIHLNAEYETLLTHSEVNDWREVGSLSREVERVWVGECALQSTAVPLSAVSLRIHIYTLSDTPHATPLTSIQSSASPSSDDEEEGSVPAASILELPSASLEGVWENLIYDGDVKGNLLGYIYSTILFGDAGIDFNVVSWNRVVLLHGPPGTGKTSLCKALAQKLAIRLSDRYTSGKLIEINSHSLFSKWFSESGKLVQKLFSNVTELVEDEGCLVVVLIDEVESLTSARAGAMSGKEPSDALRVVNALLTQLDKLKHRKNCLVMTTSNLTGAIDGAFIDRADIKQYIGLPPPRAVYWILQSCLNEIMRAGLIAPVVLHDWQAIEAYRSTGSEDVMSKDRKCSALLYELAHTCQGMSGRTLRRLPVLSHSRYIGMTQQSPPMQVWLEAMRKCVIEEGKQMKHVEEQMM